MDFLRRTLVFGALLALSMPTPALTITLKANAVVAGDYVALGDIAEISGLSEGAQLDALNRTRVATLPRPDQTLTLDRRLLTSRLRYAYPAQAKAMAWRGAEEVSVSIESQVLDSARLQAVAELALRNALVPYIDNLEITSVETIPSIAIPLGEPKVEAVPLKVDALGKRMRVILHITVGGQLVQKTAVWFAVSGYITAPIATTDIPANTQLNTNMFERRQLSLGSLALPVLYEPARLEQFRTRRFVPKASVLSRADIESAPTISRQQNVKVRIIGDGILVETSGIALSDAKIGIPVRIRNPRSGDDFIAHAIGPGLVELVVR